MKALCDIEAAAEELKFDPAEKAWRIAVENTDQLHLLFDNKLGHVLDDIEARQVEAREKPSAPKARQGK